MLKSFPTPLVFWMTSGVDTINHVSQRNHCGILRLRQPPRDMHVTHLDIISPFNGVGEPNAHYRYWPPLTDAWFIATSLPVSIFGLIPDWKDSPHAEPPRNTVTASCVFEKKQYHPP